MDPHTVEVVESRPAGPLAFRTAVAADVDAIVALVEHAYRGEQRAGAWTTEGHLIDGQRTDANEVSSLITQADSLIILAEGDGRLCGCCLVQRIDPGKVRFGMFAVAPDAQARGVGRRLIGEACRQVHAWGLSQMEMAVIRQRSDLIDWYGRLGFLPTGETEPFPYGDERFGRPRRPDLEFVVLKGPCPPLIH